MPKLIHEHNKQVKPLLRSLLYLPASNMRAIEKARSLPTDAIIFDLEDAVAPACKEAARTNAYNAIQQGGYDNRPLIIRTNAKESEWGQADLNMAIRAGAHAILVPKISSAPQITEISDYIEQQSKAQNTSHIPELWAMIEMPLAILNIHSIAAEAKNGRLHAFILGLNDLAREMKIEQSLARNIFAPILLQTALAAQSYNLTLIDAVYNDFHDDTGFLYEAENAANMGFHGKSLIHPRQIPLANKSFQPSEKAIAHAQNIVKIWSAPKNNERSAIAINGIMSERLHLEQAQELLSFARQVALKDAK